MPHATLRLRPKMGRRARAGAPWIFSNEVEMTTAAKALAPGSLVTVLGDDGHVFGTGYFNPGSLIAVRLLDAAADAAIDADFFATRFRRAADLRNSFYSKPFYRLVNAEGDRLPGLTIDRFDDALVVQITTAGMERLIDPIADALDRALNPARILLRNDTPARALESLESYGRAVKGEFGRLRLEENGVLYFVDTSGGQKTGWYYDQRDNRAFVASLAKNKTVLDAYCYTGGFALAAAKAGAKEVIGLDSSSPALALAEQAAVANRVPAKFVKADVMDELERLRGANEKFDVVVADPPPFVKSKKDLEAGARAYRKLARLAAAVTQENGFLFLASCSHNIPMDRLAAECATGIARTGRKASLVRQAGAGCDHPIHPALPESAYLKALVYAMD